MARDQCGGARRRALPHCCVLRSRCGIGPGLRAHAAARRNHAEHQRGDGSLDSSMEREISVVRQRSIYDRWPREFRARRFRIRPKLQSAAVRVSASPPISSENNPGGPANALERVLSRFGALVRRAARARGLNDSDVDEVLQDVRVRLWKSNASDEKLDGLGASYMQRTAMSAAIDLLRRRRARREASLDDMTTAGVVPCSLRVASPDRSDDEELAHRLSAALAALPSNRRIAVQLHLDGYARDEIASLTGWTEPKVRNLLYRGLDDLRDALRSDARRQQSPELP